MFGGTGLHKNKLFSNILDEIDIFIFFDISFAFLNIFLNGVDFKDVFYLFLRVVVFDDRFVFWLVAFSSVYDLDVAGG